MRGRHLVRRRISAVGLAVVLGATAVVTAAPAGAAKKPKALTVVVTNDDGVAAPGIDAVVESLRAQKKTKVIVVAPADNNSGAGEKYTAGGAPGGTGATASGYSGTAVQGFPADTIDYALDILKLKPHVVISGSNHGQNLGPISEVSGTVGAARQAARRGIPALAVSSQLGDNPDYATAARLAVEWLKERRAELLKRKPSTTPLATIDSINVPTCPGGVRGVVATTLAPEGTDGLVSNTTDCTTAVSASAVTNDAHAFNNGYASHTKVPVAPARP